MPPCPATRLVLIVLCYLLLQYNQDNLQWGWGQNPKTHQRREERQMLSLTRGPGLKVSGAQAWEYQQASDFTQTQVMKLQMLLCAPLVCLAGLPLPMRLTSRMWLR